MTGKIVDIKGGIVWVEKENGEYSYFRSTKQYKIGEQVTLKGEQK